MTYGTTQGNRESPISNLRSPISNLRSPNPQQAHLRGLEGHLRGVESNLRGLESHLRGLEGSRGGTEIVDRRSETHDCPVWYHRSSAPTGAAAQKKELACMEHPLGSERHAILIFIFHLSSIHLPFLSFILKVMKSLPRTVFIAFL